MHALLHSARDSTGGVPTCHAAGGGCPDLGSPQSCIAVAVDAPAVDAADVIVPANVLPLVVGARVEPPAVDGLSLLFL